VPLLVGLVILLSLSAAALWLSHRTSAGSTAGGGHESESAASEASVLGQAVAAAETAMDRHDDTRAAIIAAYAAMERRLAAPAGRLDSDTPTELLDRAVDRGLVSFGAAAELTDLFREARFSRHPLGPEARGRAHEALARVSDELTVRGTGAR
jgi:hypothetical protein